MQVKGIVFDLGGVITTGNAKAFSDLVQKHDLEINYELWRKLYRRASGGEILYKEFVDSLAKSASIPAKDLEARVAQVVSSRVRIVDGAYCTLINAQRLGLRCIILTNNIAEWVDIIEKRFRLRRFVPQILVSSLMRVRKPNPKAYLVAANAIGIAPQDLVYVGDEDEDIKGARSIGMKTIFIPGEESFSEYCHYRIWNLREILQLPLFLPAT